VKPAHQYIGFWKNLTYSIVICIRGVSNSGTGSGTGMCTASEAGIGSGTVFFRFFLDTLIRGEIPAVCRRVLTGICLKGFIKLIIIHTRTHKNI